MPFSSRPPRTPRGPEQPAVPYWQLWLGTAYGLAWTVGLAGLGFVLGLLVSGCTIERVVLYETGHYYPAPQATP